MPDPLTSSRISPVALTNQLPALIESLAAARTPEDVFRIVLQPALDALEAIAGAVLLVDSTGQHLEIAATQGHAEGAQTLWQDGPLTGNVPAGAALQQREALFFHDAQTLGQTYPELESRIGQALSVASAVLPMFEEDRPLGTLVLDFREPHDFTAEEQRFLRTLSAQCGIALGRANLTQRLKSEVSERTQQLEEEKAALKAFAQFTELSAETEDVLLLARHAVDVLRATLGDVSVAYYELAGDLWKARVWSEDFAPDVAAVLAAGIPLEAPSYAKALQTRSVLFVPGWDADSEGVRGTEHYGAGAFHPFFVSGLPGGLLAMGTKRGGDWRERERAVFRGVGKSLQLALERTEQARQLKAERDEVAQQNKALNAFVQLSRELVLETDRLTLIRRAQQIVLDLMPQGYASYYEFDTGLWHLRSQVGEFRQPALQQMAEAGFPWQTPTLFVPWSSQQAWYQDLYVKGTDTPPETIPLVNAVASLPLWVAGKPTGIFAVVLFDERKWSAIDRAVLETAVLNLGLALERAQALLQLEQRTAQLQQINAELEGRTAELQRSNAELEQFAYIASHDLQAPIRTVTSFAGMMGRKYGDQLDERGQLYLRHIADSGEHMKRLVDDLLTFSRVHTDHRAREMVDSGRVFDTVADRLTVDAKPGAAPSVTRTALPVLCADAQQLDQLFQNLIGNGLKYHRPDTPPRVKVSAEPDGDMWRFAVQDNGIGIETQYFGRIFEIFQRLHGRDSYEGTGIGLAVCKKIVERHGGRIWLESSAGQGTTFFFTLPGC